MAHDPHESKVALLAVNKNYKIKKKNPLKVI